MKAHDPGPAEWVNSRFLHLMQHPQQRDTFCLFHSLTKHMVFGGPSLELLYRAFDEPRSERDATDALSSKYASVDLQPIITDLRSKHMIVSDRQEDIDLYLRLFAAGLDVHLVQHMYSLTVGECNLRCAYCFVEDEHRGYPTGRMSWSMAQKSLEVFAQLTRQAEKISMTFYGGEPLMNAEVVYASMAYVRQLEQAGKFAQPVEMTLLTNGTLVDDKTVEALKQTKTGVSVSIDGPEPLHDAARKNIAGHGSFAAALAGYRRLQDAGLKPGVSCTLNRHTIDHMDEIVTFIAEELRPEGMGFNVLLPTICSGNPLDVPCDTAAERLIGAFKRLREYGIYEDRIMRRVKPFAEQGFHFKDCMGVGGQIVITPEGRVGPCQAFLGIDRYFPFSVEDLHARLPEISSETIYADPLFQEWKQRFPLNMKKCSDCRAIAVCGGGCPYAAVANAGSIWEVDTRICPQALLSLDWMVWETFERMKDQEGQPAAEIAQMASSAV